MYQNNSPFQRRNGSDHFSVSLVVTAVIAIVIASVVDNETARIVINALALALVIYSSFRMLSTNIAKRRAENDKFLALFGKKANYSSSYSSGSYYNSGEYRNATPTKEELRREEREKKLRERAEKERIKKDRKESEKIYKYYRCPKCNTELRVPRGKGKIKIKCPKCQEEFIKRT